MVARTPPKQQRKMVVVVAPPLSPTLLRETVKKVDKCVARLQELQHTVTGGKKLSLSPRNLRCKQDSLRIKNANSRRSPTGKLPVSTEEWRRMSLPAMLLGETMGEILQASQFAKKIVETVSSRPATTEDDPKTPLTERSKQPKDTSVVNPDPLHARRMREKLAKRTELSDKPLQRAKSRINFKVSSPPVQRECDKENCRYIAKRVSPRNRPWARKTVLFPNPLYHSSSSSSPIRSHHQQQFYKTKSPMITKNSSSNDNRQTPHKFLIKSPTSPSKFHVKIKSSPLCTSPTRNLAKRSSLSSSSGVAKLRRSFSPSRLANRLVSPLKSRKSSVQKKN